MNEHPPASTLSSVLLCCVLCCCAGLFIFDTVCSLLWLIEWQSGMDISSRSFRGGHLQLQLMIEGEEGFLYSLKGMKGHSLKSPNHALSSSNHSKFWRDTPRHWIEQGTPEVGSQPKQDVWWYAKSSFSTWINWSFVCFKADVVDADAVHAIYLRECQDFQKKMISIFIFISLIQFFLLNYN